MSSIRLCIRLLIKTSRALECLPCLGIRPDPLTARCYPCLTWDFLCPVVVLQVGLVGPRCLRPADAIPPIHHRHRHRRHILGDLLLHASRRLLLLDLWCLCFCLRRPSETLSMVVFVTIIISIITIVDPLIIVPLRPLLVCPFGISVIFMPCFRGYCNTRW